MTLLAYREKHRLVTFHNIHSRKLERQRKIRWRMNQLSRDNSTGWIYPDTSVQKASLICPSGQAVSNVRSKRIYRSSHLRPSLAAACASMPPKAEPRQTRPVTSWKGRVFDFLPCPRYANNNAFAPQTLYDNIPAPRRITLTLPIHSKLKSTPPSVSSTITSWTVCRVIIRINKVRSPHFARQRTPLSGFVSTAKNTPGF